MVTARFRTDFPVMPRSGMATSTRKAAQAFFGDYSKFERENNFEAVQELYAFENTGKSAPSGSQDMIGLIYSGINSFTYRSNKVFPSTIRAIHTANEWLSSVLHIVPIGPREPDYDPFKQGVFATPATVALLAGSGALGETALITRDVYLLGKSFDRCTTAWENLMPGIFKNSTLPYPLLDVLNYYNVNYAGAMLSGCGGGYILVASETKVPGSFNVTIV